MATEAGIAVRRLRGEKQLSREQLAVAAGTSASTIMRLEIDGSVPKFSILERIASELGVPVASLLSEAS